jgi:D-2-hydroxyacid dehydrogenase (NADP+)
VTTLLVSHKLHADCGARIAEAASREGTPIEAIVLPEDPAARLDDAACARVETAFFSFDVFPDHSRQFFSTVRKAPKLQWLHVFNAGVDHPIYAEMLERGVRVTTSSGAAAVPIAQTAIMGLMLFARGFPRWLHAQRAGRWDPELEDPPRDLKEQTVVVVGLGKIGAEFARLARALGLTVVGVRRGAPRPGDPVDELHAPAALPALLPRCDWLVIACPLTPETRGLVSAELIAKLPRAARIINIARGEIVDEPALIAALQDGRLAGAYLDVFGTEPLPADSPLWGLPNVIVTPHNAGAAAGNERRVLEIMLDNLGRWRRGAPLVNEVQRQR